MDKAEEFRKLIEIEVLKVIKDLAQKEGLEERIKQVARLVIDLIKPGMSLEELYQNAVKLDDRHPELSPLVFKIMKEYEQKYEKRAIEQVRAFVKSGNFDQAQDLVKKVLQYKIVS